MADGRAGRQREVEQIGQVQGRVTANSLMMRWRNRVLCTIAAAAALTTTGLALALPSGESLQRSAETFIEWTDSTRRDAEDPDLGRYQLEAQTLGGARRAVNSASSRYTAERLTNEETLRIELQALYDGVLHDRPNPPDNGLLESADPDLLPDWNGNWVFGEAGSGLDDPGDYDLDLDQRRDVAWFRYPTFLDDGRVAHAADPVDPSSPDRSLIGAAIEAGFVNSRGLFIDATLWVPGSLVKALDPQTDELELEATPTPTIVFSNGVSSSQIMYYWFAEAMAARGYLVLTYDPSGQGQSDGTWSDTFQQNTKTGDCYFGGACLDLRDAMHWMVGDDIAPRADLIGYQGGQIRPFSGPRDPSTFPANPLVDLVNKAEVGLAGHSMGALATLNYLTAMADESLPPLKAAVAMSGATSSAVASVPLQLQTSDFDGSPTLVGPGVGGVYLGALGQGIGYYPIKEMLDRLHPSAPHATSLVVFEGGVHTDHARVPYVPRTLWATQLASHYAGEWFDCHIRDGINGSCAAATSAMGHLSEAFGSEDHGPAPAATAHCIKAPSVMSLNYDAMDLASLRPRDCFGRAQ